MEFEKYLQKVRMRRIDKKYWSSKFVKDKVEYLKKELEDKDLIYGRYGMEIILSYFNPYEYILKDQAIGKRIAIQLKKEGFKVRFEDYDNPQFAEYRIVIYGDGQENNSCFTNLTFNTPLRRSNYGL